MGNLVGIAVYHLQNSFTFTERVWREAKSWGTANGKHVSAYHLNGIFGNSGENSNGTVHPGGMFSEKR